MPPFTVCQDKQNEHDPEQTLAEPFEAVPDPAVSPLPGPLIIRLIDQTSAGPHHHDLLVVEKHRILLDIRLTI